MANFLTGIRIVFAAALLFYPTFSPSFYVLYIAGSISDVLDGIVARHFKKVTKFGTKFDTFADFVFIAIVLIKIMLSVHIPLWLIIWSICIAVVKCCNLISGLIIYHCLFTEHTLMNKISGLLLFFIPLCIRRFSWPPVEILVVLTCITATFAAIQEGHYIRSGKEIR